LGEERIYNGLPVAVGDRVIARHNDRRLDVDNGTRGTVTGLDDHHVTIEADAGVVRELPASYVAEHLEHAYALTAHGMQGATIEAAFVLASPRDLTAGWSYTALSRARGKTRLLLYDREFSRERSEFAPTDHAPKAARRELLARVQRHMLERDDEELAIEQLPDAIASLRQQLAALPMRQLQRIEHLDARAVTLEAQRVGLSERLAELPEPRRRFGREDDPAAVERANLSSALRTASRELDAVSEQRDLAGREVTDPAETRAEHDRLERAIDTVTHERTATRDDREVDPHEVDLGIDR
jgi:chromosome segregation ATPase